MSQGFTTQMGASLRLRSRKTYFNNKDSKAVKLSGNESFVDERYEVNPYMILQFEKSGLSFIGKDEIGRCMEVIKPHNHSNFVGVQFYLKFELRPEKPSPLFLRLIVASSRQLDAVLNNGHINCKVATNATTYPWTYQSQD